MFLCPLIPNNTFKNRSYNMWKMTFLWIGNEIKGSKKEKIKDDKGVT